MARLPDLELRLLYHQTIMCKRLLWGCTIFAAAYVCQAQTTQGIITGRVFDHDTTEPIQGAKVTFTNLKASETGFAVSDRNGMYGIPFLPPGEYRLEAATQANDYRPLILKRVDLQIGGRIEFDFPLRSRKAVRTRGLYGGVPLAGRKETVDFFGPDVGFAAPLEVLEPQSGTLQPSLSFVMESAEINALPLRGRDPYSLLLAVPSATSDTATARSLGLSINGQRPSSSNFLFDGVENNDDLNTGTRIQLAPEFVETYRISTNNFPAETGNAAGFVANAATRSGANSFHGLVYTYFGNDVLNANSFQNNRQGVKRRADREVRPGFWAGGPLLRDRLWFSTGLEHYGMRGSGDPQTYTLPGALALQVTAPNSVAGSLLHRFTSPARDSGSFVSNLNLSPTISVGQLLLLERLDYRSAKGDRRLMGRFARSVQSQPDFVFSPYAGMSSGSRTGASGMAIQYLTSIRPTLMNDLRAGWNSSLQRLDRAHPEVPTLQSLDGVQLPGSQLLRSSADRGSTWELSDSVVWIRGRHILTAGGGYQRNRLSSTNSFGQAGYYSFLNFLDFLTDSPVEQRVAASRATLPQLNPPDLDRAYKNNQSFGFGQDAFKLSSRLSLSVGVRYDSFGTFRNTGVRNAWLALGTGSSIQERIGGAQVEYGSQGPAAPYRPDRNNWAVRTGAAYDMTGHGTTLLRAGFGIYYDRPFGLLFQNIEFNNVDYRSARLPGLGFNYLQPGNPFLPGLLTGVPNSGSATSSSGLPNFYWLDPGLRTPHIQTWFAGVERHVIRSLSLEVSQSGALGRKLVASDEINRPYSVPAQFPFNANGYLNPTLPPDIVYRSNAGASNYTALSGTVRYRREQLIGQAAYTYSHSIDNQSDPLQGEFTGLTAQSSTTSGLAAFTRQFDSRIDRASSDFDQRHNFVFFGVYRLPDRWKDRRAGRLLGGWSVAGLGAFRSGFPFTVLAPGGFNALVNNRADLVAGGHTPVLLGTPAAGGKQYLNPAAFGAPAQITSDVPGTLGRNSIVGPGFYSVDASLAKAFRLRRLGDSGRISIRGDWFNILNHTNLANPDPILLSPTFGLSQFGRSSRPSSSLLVAPLDETPRQVRFQVKVEF